MAGSRTLKLSILADVDDLRKGLNQADNEVQGFTGQLGKFGKMAGAAFAAAAAAAGAYAVKLAVDGVKAAIEDEAAQKRLQAALEATTGATNEQVKAVEAQILKTSLATGVADNNLRPALQRLSVATGDLKKSQELLTLALDISASTGKPLEAVTNALGKAYEGNTGALAKLGVGLSSAEIKSMGLEKATDELQRLFGGAASVQANTYEGRIARVKVAFDETKETIGAKLLPVVQAFLAFLTEKVFPNLSKFAEIFKPIGDAIARNKETFQEFGEFIVKYIVPVLTVTLGAALTFVGRIAGGVIDIIANIINVIKTLVGNAIDGINLIIKAYNAIPLLPNIPTISKPSFTPTVESPKIETPVTPKISVPSISTSSTGSVSTPKAGVVDLATTMSVASMNLPATSAPGQPGADAFNRGNITVNIGVAGDPEATARTIVDVLNQSTYRGTGGSTALLAV